MWDDQNWSLCCLDDLLRHAAEEPAGEGRTAVSGQRDEALGRLVGQCDNARRWLCPQDLRLDREPLGAQLIGDPL